MADRVERTRFRTVHPVHAIFLAGSFPLFLGALLSDWAYAESYQVQWTNFASWLIAGGLAFAGLALLWAIADALRAGGRSRRKWLYPALMLATFAVAFFNALVHAKDGWAAMPVGFILSAITVLLAVASLWAAYSRRTAGERR